MQHSYKTRENREKAAVELFQRAKDARSEKERGWTKFSDYYEGKHRTPALEGMGFMPACCTDVYLHVETQVDPKIPACTFYGRDSDMDNRRAKQRQYVVEYILENNKLEAQNSRNERRLLKYGSAFWKCFYDENMPSSIGGRGDIRIIDVPVESLFPDPANRSSDINDCEYVDYVYYIHRRKAERLYGGRIRGMSLENMGGGEREDDLFAPLGTAETDETIRVLEHWYRDEDGDIACSVLLGETEVQHIPKYWENTRGQNKNYPFVHYWRIANENEFWQRSEVEQIIDLVDAVDRELAIALYNDAMTSSDMFLVEEDALADGQELTNMPGSVLKLKPGQSGRVQRLLGAHTGIHCMPMISALQEQIARTVGNFDATQGSEPLRVTTASGIAQLNERADARRSLKRADRLDGFKRLYQLCDWSALEFYDDGRLIRLGTPDDGSGGYFMFDPTEHRMLAGGMRDIDGEVISESKSYFPIVDVVVAAGDGIAKSTSFTVSVLEKLATMPVTAENYKLLCAFVEMVDIPQAAELAEFWRNMYERPAAVNE